MVIVCFDRLPDCFTPVCKEWPGSLSTAGVEIDRGSARLQDESAATASHSKRVEKMKIYNASSIIFFSDRDRQIVS